MKKSLILILLSLVLTGAGIGLVGCDGEDAPVDEIRGPAGAAETPEVPPGEDTEETGPAGPAETPEVPPAE